MNTTTKVKNTTKTHFAIRQTISSLALVSYSGDFSSKEEAEAALSPRLRGMHVGRVDIVRVTSTSRLEVDTTVEVV